MLAKLFGKKQTDQSLLFYRRDGLLRQMDFLLDTLENNKFDIVYMENLKNPLTDEQNLYFIQQVDRIESAKKILIWMKENIKQNTPLWKRFLKW